MSEVIEKQATDALFNKDYSTAILHYNTLLNSNPNSFFYHNNLGNLFLITKNIPKAIDHLKKAVTLNHDKQFLINIYYNLASAYQLQNAFPETLDYLTKIINLNPKHENANKKLITIIDNLESESSFENYYTLGVLYYKIHNYKKAIYYYELSLTLTNDFAVNYNLGSLYQKIDNLPSAINYYQRALEIKFDPSVKFLIQALNNGAINNPPEEYIKDLFNFYAVDYDHAMRNNLNYQVPKYIEKILTENVFISNNKFNILDLGCGTGIIGEMLTQYSKFVRNIYGVDLSQQMLDIAFNKQVYNNLYLDNINDILNKDFILDKNINLVIAADVLVYLGDLEVIFQKIYHNFKNSYFIFSVEELIGKDDYLLNKNCRFQHNNKYLLGIIKKFGFSVVAHEKIVLRKNKDLDVNGSVYLIYSDAVTLTPLLDTVTLTPLL